MAIVHYKHIRCKGVGYIVTFRELFPRQGLLFADEGFEVYRAMNERLGDTFLPAKSLPKPIELHPSYLR